MRKSFSLLLATILLSLSVTPAFAQITAIDSEGNPANVSIESVPLSETPLGQGKETLPLQTKPTDLGSPILGSDAPTVASEAATSEEEATAAETTASEEEEDAGPEGLFSLRRVTKWGSVLVSIALVVVVLMQERGVGLSSTFGGTGGFYANKRGAEKVLFRLTIVLAIIFAGLNIAAMFA